MVDATRQSTVVRALAGITQATDPALYATTTQQLQAAQAAQTNASDALLNANAQLAQAERTLAQAITTQTHAG